MAQPRRLLVALACLALAGCGGGSKHAVSTSAVSTHAAATVHGCATVPAPPAHQRTAPKPTQALDPAKTYDVTLQTNCGSFTFQLAVKTSPKTTASFVSLVKRGFYDKTVFHRIVSGFVIQGGDPTGTGEGGPGYLTVDKPPKSTKYTHGLVAMAKTSTQPPGTSGSQFFVMTADAPQLPADYAVLGRVVRGLGVVDRIGKLDGGNGQPSAVVEIEHASVTAH